ncbi:MAG: glycerophosphoryl diester phosphodiesterase membrane domain-containing protein [Clostridiales bacterium]|nr:glycerophosphoryl diester phosphodiesterase membrane domain-containing protein [Clostridiales bacterium]
MNQMKMVDKSAIGVIKTKGSGFYKNFLYFIKNVLILFRQNFKEVMLFILFCTVVTAVISNTLKNLLLNAMMNVSGQTFIAPVNMREVFLNPLSIVMALVFAIVVTLFSLFEIAGLLHAFSMAQIGRETNLSSMFMAGLRACRKAVHPQNWFIIIFIMILFPLTKVMPLSGSTVKLILPGFVNQTIDYTQSLFVLYNVIYLALIIFLTVYIFSINSFVMQENSFVKSCTKSRKLVTGNFFEVLITLILLTIILNFLINSLSSIIVVNAKEFISFLQRNRGNIVAKSEDVGTYTYVLRQILKSFISPAVNNAALTVLFFRYIEDKGELTSISRDMFKAKKYPKKISIAFFAVPIVLLIGVTVFVANRYSFLAEKCSKPLVCAHRGDNVNAPENTLPAFEMAASENLKWIELDVHQTSDGVIVCNHDSSIKRTAGVNLAIHDNTYEELVSHELGEWMPGDYDHVKMTTLREALRLAKLNHMNVQVELKGHKDDVGFEENVLKVINETEMHDNVMIIAQDASRLRRIYELDPGITKGYCMFIAIGNVEDIYYTDNITIEETNVTPELVRRLHAQGKKVFCWTVDLDDTVQYLVSCGVDVIGTDNPMLITNALDKADYSGGFRRVFHILMHIIANMDK